MEPINGYDEWKLATPPEYDGDPDACPDCGEASCDGHETCDFCDGAGRVRVGLDMDAACPDCDGEGSR